MKNVRFAKYQGAGNDFILLDARHDAPALTRPEIRALCERRFGIGADGLMTLENSATPGCDFRMRYYNADGGESTMCGNGGRCIVRFADHLGIGGRVKRFDSSDGIHTAELLDDRLVRLQMIDTGAPEKLADGRSWFLFTGSPHYVEFTDRLDGLDVERLGATIRRRADFEAIGGTNVNFVEVAGEGQIRVRTFERGVEAETWACGTGVTAAALVTHAVRQPECFDFTVETRGGILGVTFAETETGTFADIRLTGPAERIFEGEIEI
ncbi:diaminopimelate epimerase [uncultured Rikenella sp.]|uniref:diaminopimelate epimerase n=1 Tax=uncultured Rikenella sp. TaxID=368003 RepID=UPI0025FFA83F|nr:diaminopimelate epimerase [uncultured Rikenella sp.]